jgi:hypothetical protein
MSHSILSQEILGRAKQFAGSQHGRLIGESGRARHRSNVETYDPATTASLGISAGAGPKDVTARFA